MPAPGLHASSIHEGFGSRTALPPRSAGRYARVGVLEDGIYGGDRSLFQPKRRLDSGLPHPQLAYPAFFESKWLDPLIARPRFVAWEPDPDPGACSSTYIPTLYRMTVALSVWGVTLQRFGTKTLKQSFGITQPPNHLSTLRFLTPTPVLKSQLHTSLRMGIHLPAKSLKRQTPTRSTIGEQQQEKTTPDTLPFPPPRNTALPPATPNFPGTSPDHGGEDRHPREGGKAGVIAAFNAGCDGAHAFFARRRAAASIFPRSSRPAGERNTRSSSLREPNWADGHKRYNGAA
ncbi:hypothetical protein GRF29_19g3108329 [Pseudopithomyces chartarum]|uniref:Uncharacterized protein n=1 Tax=Pseudopithomyces chartarum TaxID=1892770 RepID=A0AAN6M6V2_9PLEO|nr:hypothetical protein GRF29_19g3108329 [Pseudopithomyces chartarum]